MFPHLKNITEVKIAISPIIVYFEELDDSHYKNSNTA